MDAQQKAIAEECLAASYEGTVDFPDVVKKLLAVGFEGYIVDYRRSTTTYYLPNGESVQLPNVKTRGTVAAEFKLDTVEAAVREAQAKAADYTYKRFCAKVKAAGCAGYFVSLLGKRVIYYGRTAETHVEYFPQ